MSDEFGTRPKLQRSGPRGRRKGPSDPSDLSNLSDQRPGDSSTDQVGFRIAMGFCMGKIQKNLKNPKNPGICWVLMVLAYYRVQHLSTPFWRNASRLEASDTGALFISCVTLTS